MTTVGAMRMSSVGMAAELDWTFKKFNKTLSDLLKSGLIEYDSKSFFISAPNFMKYNKPQSPNVIKTWPQAFDLLPDCELKNKLGVRLERFLGDSPKGFLLAFNRCFPNGFESFVPDKKKSVKSSKKTNEYVAVEIPASLNTEEFKTKWADWIAYKKECRKKFTKTSQERILKRLEPFGSLWACERIDLSIASSWQGLVFSEDVNRKKIKMSDDDSDDFKKEHGVNW